MRVPDALQKKMDAAFTVRFTVPGLPALEFCRVLADLPQAISLNTISFNLARSVGPALGGFLISVWNVSLAFAINDASFVALIVLLAR